MFFSSADSACTRSRLFKELSFGHFTVSLYPYHKLSRSDLPSDSPRGPVSISSYPGVLGMFERGKSKLSGEILYPLISRCNNAISEPLVFSLSTVLSAVGINGALHDFDVYLQIICLLSCSYLSVSVLSPSDDD